MFANLSLPASISIQDLQQDGDELYYISKGVLHKNRIPQPLPCIQSSIYGYGGGSFCVKNGLILATEKEREHPFIAKDSEIIRIQGVHDTYACYTIHPFLEYAFAIGEYRRSSPPFASVVRISLKKPYTITEISLPFDFILHCSCSPNGSTLAVIGWNAPWMPWQTNTLILYSISKEGTLSEKQRISFSEGAFCDFAWINEDEYAYTHDKSGFWEVYYSTGESITTGFDLSLPPWSIGTYRFLALPNGDILSVGTKEYQDNLVYFSRKDLSYSIIPTPYCCIRAIASNGVECTLYGSCPTIPLSITTISLKKPSQQPFEEKGLFSIPYSLCVGSLFAWVYPPLTESVHPPIIIRCHGGPTTHADRGFNSVAQLYARSGFMYIDLNYRGSSGAGRAFRTSLDRHYGQYDVEDLSVFAQHLKTLYPHSQLFLRGGSSAGLTVLLGSKTGFFDAGICLYGITDLSEMRLLSHGLERFYFETLIGESSSAEYTVRSPIHYADSYKTPFLFIHGGKDLIVPFHQTYRLFTKIFPQLSRSQYLYLPTQGHGISHESLAAVFKEELNFLRSFLRKK